MREEFSFKSDHEMVVSGDLEVQNFLKILSLAATMVVPI
jgi:hypothetical protein